MDHAVWLELLFAHDSQAWYLDPAAEIPALPAAETAAHVLRLLEAPRSRSAATTRSRPGSNICSTT